IAALTDACSCICRVAAEPVRRKSHAGAKNSHRARTRQRMLLEPCDRHAGEHASGGTTVDADILGAIVLQQLAIGGSDVLAGRGKAMLGTLPIIETHYSNASNRG